MSTTWKTQLLRVARLFGFAFIGVLIPFVAGLHGAVSLTAIEAAVIVAGEAGFRAIFPSIEAWMLPPLDPAKVDATIKDIYLPVIQTQLNATSPLVERLSPAGQAALKMADQMVETGAPVPVATAEPTAAAPEATAAPAPVTTEAPPVRVPPAVF